MSDEITMNDLITVKQLPVIEQQLMAIKQKFSEVAEYALSLDCTEETLQTVKKKRAELSKIFKALEAKRIEAKKEVMAPYESFEAIYKECVTNIYSPCDAKLSEKIREVENGLKKQKSEEAEQYFTEYCRLKGIDFVSFYRLDLNITISASKKSIREHIKSFVDKIADELALIDTQEHREEILVEYKKTLNVATSITAVANRHKAIAEEKKRAETAAERKAEKAEKLNVVNEAIAEFSAPVAKSEEKENLSEEKKYEVSFKVVGTMGQIKALKEFLVTGGYEYEQE